MKAPVVDRQRQVGHEVGQRDQDRAQRGDLAEEYDRIGVPAEDEAEPDSDAEEDTNAAQGVRWRSVTCATQEGSSPSRPELKMIRACELVAAISVPKIDVKPAR
jgi:hypothetical protein